ncbi:LRR receptor-like serine/threonine-protein kinase ERECTA [Aristolochia californica]|uniref:LRR receptor-like serine/threonine-protein kinase ERECTA n=1 Tax=Aristolochia californica TaxID=171875 RepID=UPI0035DFE522
MRPFGKHEELKTSTVLLFFLIFDVALVFDLAYSDDGATLLEIKKSFRDVDNVLYDWVNADSSDYCSWRGVICDNVTFDVVALNLSGLNLGGEISPEIGNLKGLLSIDLTGNHLSGQIPDEIGSCSLLNSLDLSSNDLYGDIPFSISNLKQLEALILKNNQLTGPIPSTLSQIPNLKILDLAQNKLTGDIPRLIYWNEVLQYLGLRGNNLVGTLSPDMCQLTGLWFFDVRNNSLSGSIPTNIGNCTGFQVLDLSYNHLTGEIPFNIGFLQVATLSLQGNRLSGSIPPVIGLMQALAVLDLSCNLLGGPIPPILGNLTYTEKLYLQGNMLTGSIPPELGNMTKLHYLELSDNHLTGHIPSELGRLTDLFDLNLADNKLEGPIPENLSSCVNLNNLNVYGNELNGTIPRAFEKLESMTYLNLSSNNLKGPIPIELSRIGNLDTLDLSNNEISGSIPASVGDLEHLLKLNLRNNHLEGYIPEEFGNLRSVMDIDLSNNHLSGSLPEELGQLQNLFSLRLENNTLSGNVLSLINCLSLAVLNVSYNNLAGYIPSGNNFSRFSQDSFLGNPGLCGDWLNLPCHVHQQPPKASMSKAAILAITFGSAAIILMILVAACRPHTPTHFSEGSPNKPVSNISPKLVIFHMNMALHLYEDIMRMTENLSEKYIIGYGASSTVYKCVLKNCRPVAIKRLYSHYPQSLKEFETELETVGSIKHRNLVSLQGYSLSPSGNLLFYDYMENGSLWDLLHGKSKKKKVDWETRLRIALGSAHGLAYLHHDCSPRIIHRDVKSSNILLDKDFEAHLTDFGIAKSLCLSKTHTSTYIIGTIGYIDPEYARTSRLNEKSDVYSFGIVLLEILTGRKAVDNDCNLLDLILSKTASNGVMETVDPEISTTCKDLNVVKKVFQLALLCSKKQPADRPTMHEVSRVLESLVPAEEPPTSKEAMPPPPSSVTNYVRDYNLKNPNAMACATLSSTSDANLFLRFGEVISQNTTV